MIYAIQNYAGSRQLRNYFAMKKPIELEKIKAIKDENFKKGQEHSKDVLAFKMYQAYNDIIFSTIVWAFFIPAYVWNLSAKLLSY